MIFWRRTKSWRTVFALGSLLMLILATSGCPKSPSTILPPEEAQLAICKDGSPEERKAWNRVIDLAELPDDPFEVALGVRWLGNYLHRCGIK